MTHTPMWTLQTACPAVLRGLLVLLLMVVAGSGAAYYPTAQVACHTMDGTAPLSDESVCVLACGVAHDTHSESVGHQRVAYQISRDVPSALLRGIETEPDVPPPRTSD